MRELRNKPGYKKSGIILLVTFIFIFSNSLFSSEEVLRSGVGLKFASFGIPNSLLDKFVFEHPTLTGSSFAFEYRSYGKKGPSSAVSRIYSLEYSHMSGAGPWRTEEDNIQLDSEGEASQVTMTATIVFSIFPSFVVHPYFGVGIGVGKVAIWSEGTYENELGNVTKDTYTKNLIIPVAHIPVGLRINLNDKVEIRIEGGFKNGFYFGGGAVYNF